MKTDDASEFDQCFACDIPLARGSWQSHHFPVPKNCGGTASVKLCLPCHDMVDRIGFGNWPVEFIVKGWATMTREARLFVMKAIAILSAQKSERSEETEGG